MADADGQQRTAYSYAYDVQQIGFNVYVPSAAPGSAVTPTAPWLPAPGRYLRVRWHSPASPFTGLPPVTPEVLRTDRDAIASPEWFGAGGRSFRQFLFRRELAELFVALLTCGIGNTCEKDTEVVSRCAKPAGVVDGAGENRIVRISR